MLGLDTNVLIRLLIDDDSAPKQCLAARQLVSEAGKTYVPQVVQIETVWVLSSAYGLNRSGVEKTLSAIAHHPAITLQRPDMFNAALEHYRTSTADFADCMILVETENAGCELATFDRKLGKLPGARLISA